MSSKQKPSNLSLSKTRTPDILIITVACSILSHELINSHVLCSELEQKANLTEN